MNHNFVISVLDTDSLTISKPDGSEFTESEIKQLTKEINDQSEELIRWDFEFYIPKLIVVKSKNYILDYGDGKIKTKGSSIRDQKKEKALADMMNELIKAMLDNQMDQLTNIYNKYVVEAYNVKDIRRWCAKKTITRPILDCKGWTPQQVETKELRMNEISIWEAVKNEDIFEGDKVYLYPTYHVKEVKVKVLKNGRTKETPVYGNGLSLDKHYDPVNSNLDVDKLVSRCYNTVKIFSSILDIDKLFINYSLNKNKELLQDLLRKK